MTVATTSFLIFAASQVGTPGPANMVLLGTGARFGFRAALPFVGGVILGVAQTIGAKIDPGWQVLAGHIAFLVVLAVRPNGLFPRVEH